MEYDILKPWETLDDWQQEYIKAEGNCFLLCGRQSGKSTAASIKAVELAVHKHAKGQDILIIAFTERQAYNLYAKCLNYAQTRYRNLIKMGKDKPTKHEFIINDVKIMCHPCGLNGDGLRGFTIKKAIVDEAAAMSKDIFTAVLPMLSVTGGTIDLLSTPRGKEGFFYSCSLDDNYQKFYVSAEDCPRHDKKFLESMKLSMSKLDYAQEYLAMFLDDLKRLFPDTLLKEICVLKRQMGGINGKYYLGVDVAGLGQDLSTFEIIKKNSKEDYRQVENLTTRHTFTTDTTRRIINLHEQYKFRGIGVDDGGIGFGVFSQLLDHDACKRRVHALNNSRRPLDKEGKKSKRILKEEMYFNLLNMMERKEVKLLDDDEIIESLASVQFEMVTKEGKPTEWIIHGNNTHIAEGIIRAFWLATQDKSLNIWFTSV